MEASSLPEKLEVEEVLPCDARRLEVEQRLIHVLDLPRFEKLEVEEALPSDARRPSKQEHLLNQVGGLLESYLPLAFQVACSNIHGKGHFERSQGPLQHWSEVTVVEVFDIYLQEIFDLFGTGFNKHLVPL